jgi:hypothetical protein
MRACVGASCRESNSSPVKQWERYCHAFARHLICYTLNYFLDLEKFSVFFTDLAYNLEKSGNHPSYISLGRRPSDLTALHHAIPWRGNPTISAERLKDAPYTGQLLDRPLVRDCLS